MGRQIFELIKGEMEYVKDLENIEAVCIFHSIESPDCRSDHTFCLDFHSALEKSKPNKSAYHSTGKITSVH